MPATDCRLGVIAFGDSITNGGGELQWGVALQSWAQWVARGLGVPFTNYAVDGARVEGVVGEQIPAFVSRSRTSGARYDVGCLYIGVNDVRQFTWDARVFEAGFRRAVAFLVERCDRVLVVTAPLDLGRPRAGAKVEELNAVVSSVASDAGALLVDLSGLRARNRVMADRVHLSAFGQVAVAERALAVLAADGLPPAVWPSALISYETSWVGRLRGDWTYVYRYVKDFVKRRLASS